MAKKDFLKSDPIGDMQALINSDFNKVIRKSHASLSTKTYSPVYTGFFASSWKVANTPIKATQKVEDFKPWAEIKSQSKGKRPLNPKVTKGGRFPVKRTFDFKIQYSDQTKQQKVRSKSSIKATDPVKSSSLLSSS